MGFGLIKDEPVEVQYKFVERGGNVPGGHNVLWNGKTKPFITPMKECNSIPLRYSDVVVDIGAYIGTYAIRCARFPVKRVIAYEPTPSTFSVLSLTSLPNLELVNAAVVHDDRSAVDLFISKGIGVTNSIAKSTKKARRVEVPAVKYEEVVKDASIVKIDVEGAEYDYPVVQPSLRAIIIDFHPVDCRWREKAGAMIDTIEAGGFEPVVKPNWTCGWTYAGSWIRPMETFGEFKSMLQGVVCCGCGCAVLSGGSRTLCSKCWQLWTKKHREGFVEERII